MENKMDEMREHEKKPLYDIREGLGRRRGLSREGIDPDQEVVVPTQSQQKQFEKQ